MFQVWRSRDGDGRHGGAFQFERLYARVTRWRVVMVGVGLLAYVSGLALFLPAEVAVGRKVDAVGTVWNGQVGFAPGFAADWRLRPVRSLITLGAAGDFAVTGPETSLTGQAVARPDGVVIQSATGSASLRLLPALLPALPFACDGDMRIEARSLALRGGVTGSGAVNTGPATCAAPGGATSSTPPMAAALSSDAQGASATLTGADGARLAQSRTTKDGGLSVTVDAAAAGLFPGVVPVTLDTRL